MQKISRSYTALIIFLALSYHLLSIDKINTPTNIPKSGNCNTFNEHHLNKPDTTYLKDTTGQINKQKYYVDLNTINFSTENNLKFEIDKASLDPETIHNLLSIATDSINYFDILGGISSYFLPMKILVINSYATSKFIESNSPTQQEIEIFNTEFENADDFFKQFLHPIIWRINNFKTFKQLYNPEKLYFGINYNREFKPILDTIKEQNYDPLTMGDVLNLISLSYIEHNFKEKHYSYVLDFGNYYNPKKENFCLNRIERSVEKFKNIIDIKHKESLNLHKREHKEITKIVGKLKIFIERAEQKLKDIKERFVPGLEQNFKNARTNDKLELNIPFYNAMSLNLKDDRFYISILDFLILFYKKLLASEKEQENTILLNNNLLKINEFNRIFCTARRYTSKIVMENTIEFMRYITNLKQFLFKKIKYLEKEHKYMLSCDIGYKESEVVEPNKFSYKLNTGSNDENPKSNTSNEESDDESITDEVYLKIEIIKYKNMRSFLMKLLNNTKRSLEKANLTVEIFNQYISFLPYWNPIKNQGHNSFDNKTTENIENDTNINCNDTNGNCNYTNENCNDRNINCNDTNEQCDDINKNCIDTNENCDDINENCNERNINCNVRNINCNDTNEQCDDINKNYNDKNENCNYTNENCNDRNINCNARNINCNDTNEQCDDINKNYNDKNENCNDRNINCNARNINCNDTNGIYYDTNEMFDCGAPSFSVEISEIKPEDYDKNKDDLIEKKKKEMEELILHFKSIKLYYIVAYQDMKEISNSEGMSADELYKDLQSFGF